MRHRHIAALLAAASCLVLAAPAGAAPHATHLIPSQLARMNTCSDQQNGTTTGPDACREFVPGGRSGARTVLTRTQQNRMAECIDQQTGGGTAGAEDTCAEFVHAARGRR